MKIRAASKGQTVAAKMAERRLQAALQFAKFADCPKLANKIRRAIKSAGGAVRHARHRYNRSTST